MGEPALPSGECSLSREAEAWSTNPHLQSGWVNEIVVIREGEGPEVLLVHGGASPRTTWRALSALSSRWTLAFVHRRGYPPSPRPPEGRQDFDVDANDLTPLLDRRPHVVAHSYGVLGTLIAAARRPECVRSLTLIEPPIYFLVERDPEVARLEAMGNAVLTHGLDTDAATLGEFLSLAGAPNVGDGPLPEDVASGVRRAQGGRLPGEANLALDALRQARIPSLVASGKHSQGLERICDALAAAVDAERLIAPGAGHFVAAAPNFADRLEQFLLSAEQSSPQPASRD
jgi:pimeloyl-ACP methyl ester carboxylesterase